MTAPRTDFRDRLAFASQLLRQGLPPLPTHTLDQLDAAGADTRVLHDQLGAVLPIIEPDRTWRQRIDGSPSETVRGYLLAAILGCTTICIHIRRGGPQPAIVRLPLHRIDCGRCVQTLRKPPVGEDDRCDLCGKPETLTFIPFAVRQGPALIAGDVCTSCAGTLGILDVAA